MPKSSTNTKRDTGSVLEQPRITIGTLAARTGITVAGPVVTRGGRLLSSSIHGGINGGTLGDPHLIWGAMVGDLSLAELEAFLELDGPLTPNNIPDVEIASRGRVIRSIGTLDPSPGSARSVIDMDNHSQKGLKFSEAGEGSQGGWDWWVYNISDTTPMTTGSEVVFQARNFVEWNPSG